MTFTTMFTALTNAVEIGFEVAGELALVIGAVLALLAFGGAILRAPPRSTARAEAYRALRDGLGRAILLGLELLVAADIIRSVTVDPTFTSVGVLGLLVLVRTFLSWSLEVEITGQWPWQRSPAPTPKTTNAGV